MGTQERAVRSPGVPAASPLPSPLHSRGYSPEQRGDMGGGGMIFQPGLRLQPRASARRYK